MSKSCSCGGSNENCCWCFGTGIVSDKPARRKSKRARTFSAGVSKKQASNAKVICDRCSFVGSMAQVAEHERNTHQNYDGMEAERREKKVKEVSGELPAGGKIICPLCRYTIDSPNYYYHVKSMHPSGAQQQPAPLASEGFVEYLLDIFPPNNQTRVSGEKSTQKQATAKVDTRKEQLQRFLREYGGRA